jgi:hypothetical protein
MIFRGFSGYPPARLNVDIRNRRHAPVADSIARIEFILKASCPAVD